MSRREDLTIIVARSAYMSARRYKVSRKLLASLGMAVAVMFASFLLSSLHYYYMWKQTADHLAVEARAYQLDKENETFRLVARQLNEKISSLEVTSKKLQILSGLDQESLGGVGGPSTFDNYLLSLDSQDLLEHFTSLERKSISLESNLIQLQDLYNTRTILLAATPALIPVSGYPSGRFGYRIDPFNGEREFHPGIDISAPRGNKVIATADGVVTTAGRKYSYGKLVMIEHKFGLSTRYGHLDRYTVERGQKVKRGDIIGYVGSTGRATGPHLHYEVRLNDRPLNPLRFFRD
ncbi:MAG: M23 family metallopeptidase [Acidobacteria bacterium]|nr:M23 family metallopeptidase [Acidobacteriota bacterium]